MPHICRSLPVLLLFAVSWLPHAALAAPVEIRAKAIESFKPGSSETRFGSFEFVGGLELWSKEALFGAWSSIRFRPDQQHFIGVLDTGHWLVGKLQRSAAGKITGIADAAISPMADKAGRFQQGKYLMDAESLAIRGDKVMVGFEQRHRIDVYPLDGFETARPVDSLPLPFSAGELRSNGGLETIAVAPDGRLITVAERSVDKKGRLFAGVVEKASTGDFRVARRDSFDVTDGAFLPNGDLLLLERRFSLATGVAMRIQRIKGSDIKPGAVIQGQTVLEADYGYQIDNMEGLDIVNAPDGSIHVIIVSDDNHSILQRNLILEFRLVE